MSETPCSVGRSYRYCRDPEACAGCSNYVVELEVDSGERLLSFDTIRREARELAHRLRTRTMVARISTINILTGEVVEASRMDETDLFVYRRPPPRYYRTNDGDVIYNEDIIADITAALARKVFRPTATAAPRRGSDR